MRLSASSPSKYRLLLLIILTAACSGSIPTEPSRLPATGGSTQRATGTASDAAPDAPGVAIDPAPAALSCTIASQPSGANDEAVATASGGIGEYLWDAPGSSTTSASGARFRTTYATPGAKVISVSSGAQTAQCLVDVPATLGQYTVSGPSNPLNCFTAGTTPMRWVLNVSDAGPETLRIVALTHFDDTPGCAPTTRNPRPHLEVTGNTSYAPRASGQSTFTFDPRLYSCGRVQADVSIFDSADRETLIVGVVIDYGTVCPPLPDPPPPALSCAPAVQNTSIGAPVVLTASGGTGTYTWTSAGGSPTGGSGAQFTTSFSTSGPQSVVVSSGSATASCQVSVGAAQGPPLVCTPPTQTGQTGQPITFGATGGTGAYAWAAPGGATSAGTGASFITSYPGAGTNTVTVTSGTVTSACQVVIQPSALPVPLECTPANQTVGIGQAAAMLGSGGTGDYSWSSPGATTPSGAGAHFNPSYATGGTYTATVISGSQSASCRVTVPAAPPPPPPTLACAPPTQTVAINQAANVNATGGTGAYSWSAPGASTPTGAGVSFATSYAAAGTNTITVTSGAQTATCQVVVPPPPPQLVCAPPTQTVNIGQTATVGATGGIGTYSWTAPGGTIVTGSGAAFSTSYPTAGVRLITVTSGAQTATCQVTVPPPAVNSCVGVTATVIQPLLFPNGSVRVVVPAGQQSSIVIGSLDHRTDILTTFNYTLGPGTTVLTVPIACFPKIDVSCGATLLDSVRGANQCPQ